MLLHPEPQHRGRLQHPDHPDDLLSHTFFMTGFCPKHLPQTANTQPPKLPLETLYDSNLSVFVGHNQTLNLENGGSNPNSSIRLRSTLKQKFNQVIILQYPPIRLIATILF